ncbi:hypothetical protein MGG_11888 [Pyricularia oryzae 70-15]|uniref:HECT-type E3 ubiquitin transferase n=2 Tax=Pyricularia oryzae TaxID=318829 RepID=G4MKA9_PYRO7|nr:uncharacterized protein MGG_11888 [Pyricularia oryzae 70-15]EHA56700.1 hypothetical protein MGG_11888 [Pyricularia oryzae 70-15]KAI7930197.1 hypothetical protein M9X92_000972 [Pyricularia oryzae]KAI7930280.1 hypothetical protein M0657_001749 [Pyricularia oryzae]
MTRDTHRRSSDAQDPIEAEIFVGLWEHAAFPRLPRDAPSVLEDLVEDVENPKRVYTIHRASRRHNFQLLVQKFVVQLRDGCGSTTCNTPTCFSCRRRTVGRAPLRRYNTTSARTIAVFLASQDNADAALCPTLRSPKTPPAALNSLIFSKVSNQHPRPTPSKLPASSGSGSTAQSTRHQRRSSSSREKASENDASSDLTHGGTQASTHVTMTERHVSKDYRSFAANMFGTVAFKMLEWLTPAGLEELSRKAKDYEGGHAVEAAAEGNVPVDQSKTSGPLVDKVTETAELGSGSSPRIHGDHETETLETGLVSAPGSVSSSASSSSNGSSHTSNTSSPNQVDDQCPSEQQQVRGANGDALRPERAVTNGHSVPSRPCGQRQNSNARVRTPSTKPKRNLSIDTFPSEQAGADELFPTTLISPLLNGISQEKGSRPNLKPGNATIPRPISQLSNTGIFGGVPLETMPPPKTNTAENRPKPGYRNPSDTNDRKREGIDPTTCSPGGLSSSERSCREVSPCDIDNGFERAYSRFLPQSLSRLNPEIIDMFCDILQDDSTAESHLFEPRYVCRHDSVREGISHNGKLMQRKQLPPGPYPSDMLLRWMMFIEQSFFYVLSDPRRLIRSFTKKGQLFDSQTLWYCMLRMSRVAPTVVIHSLWIAAEALFVPPKSVQSLRSPTARLFPKQETSLTDDEAGMLLSICMHLLIAVAPLTFSKEELQDMSRIRAHGLILARTGTVSRPSTQLCLAYNDAFANDLAIRLARRLFAAITTRNYFKDMAAMDIDSTMDGESPDLPDVLEPLFQQLDFLNADTMYMLHFSIPSRAVHEIRAPTLLLDWARNVMLHEWDGQPIVPGDGPFGGALALLKAMHEKRRLLVLADSQFRADYFADRLDEVDVPVSWLSFTSTRQKRHLLDFPFMFSSSKLVSYFRSINFSRMSRSFEESNSLHDRISAIVPPRGNLIINPHHKNVLQDMLKAASSKYLVLSISRERVLEDTFDQLWRREERELLRPLKVRLGEGNGEEGFDSGGVQQEFFRMVMAEALNPDYGLFTVDERTKMTWFHPGSPEPDWKFELIGLLFSLAVYNGLTLPVTFPEALYCKLLGEPVTDLHHISDGWPELASGLTTLLDWDESAGSVEDVFSLTYEFSVSMFGQPVSRQMESDQDAQWPCFPSKYAFGGTALSSSWSSGTAPAPPLHEGNPSDAPAVTRDNRNAYVADYVRYLTDVSVRPQFEAFARGFRTCLGTKPLTLLAPRLLRSIVEGVQDIDVAELRRHARYVGWDASHRTVRDFWSVVRKFDDSMRRKLLEFVTASDRVPVGGLKNLQFVIQRNGEEDEGGHLPTAYTCYGILLLPQYRDKEVLRERLCMALGNAQGFGFA